MKLEPGELRYRGHKVNPETFEMQSKDLRRLIGQCRRCNTVLCGREAVPTPDPFASNVYHDNTPVVQCAVCDQAAREAI